MFERTVTPDDLARLKREREAADRAYNEALSRFDAVKLQPSSLPHPPPGYDEHQFTRLNEPWDPLAGGTLPRPVAGWRSRAAEFIWNLLAPVFERQRTFNSAIVDHVNRNIAMHRGTRDSI